MNITKRKPVSVGEMLTSEFLEPLAITQEQLARAMGVSRKTVNEICRNKRSITADTALMLSTVFDNSPEFWLNLQRRNDIWEALNTPRRAERIKRAVKIQPRTLKSSPSHHHAQS